MNHSSSTPKQWLSQLFRSALPVAKAERRTKLKLDNLEERAVQGAAFNGISALFLGVGPTDPMQAMAAAVGDIAMLSSPSSALPKAVAPSNPEPPRLGKPLNVNVPSQSNERPKSAYGSRTAGDITQPDSVSSRLLNGADSFGISLSTDGSGIANGRGSSISTNGDVGSLSGGPSGTSSGASFGNSIQSNGRVSDQSSGGFAADRQQDLSSFDSPTTSVLPASATNSARTTGVVPSQTSSGSSATSNVVVGKAPETFVTPPSNKVSLEKPSVVPTSAVAAATISTSSIFALGSDAGTTSKVRIYDSQTQAFKSQITPFANSFLGGVRVAVADVTGDGKADVIVAQGAGGTNQVRVYDGATGKAVAGTLGSFTAFTTAQANGVFVAAADVNGDGKADIIVGGDGNGTPTAKVFSGVNGALLKTLTFTDLGFSGGLRVGAGDVTGDGKADIVVSGGAGGSSRVVVLDSTNYSQKYNFFAFDPTDTGGVNLAVGDFNGDGYSDIITGQASGGSWVNVFSGANSSYLARVETTPGFAGGIRVGAVDANLDGKVDVLVGQGPTGGTAQILSSPTGSSLASLQPFGAAYASGMFAAGDARPGPPGIQPFVLTPTVTIATVVSSAQEGGTLGFVLTRDITTSSMIISVSYSGTATSGSDFSGLTSFFFTAGQSTQSFTVGATADSLLEGPESLIVSVASGSGYTIGTPGVATGIILDGTGPLAAPPGSQTGSAGSTTTTSADSNAGSSGGSGETSSGIRAIDGVITTTEGDLFSFGFGKAWGADRGWTNSPPYAAAGGSYEGNGVVSGALPNLRKDSSSVVVITAAGDAEYFDISGSSYVPRNFSKNSLAYNSTTKLFTFKDSNGNVAVYYDFDASRQTAEKGRLKSLTDNDGNVVDASASNAAGQPSEITRTGTVGAVTTDESYLYTYLSSGTNSGKISNITLRRRVNAGSWSTIRQVDYTYYDTGSSLGTAGDLKLASVKDASGSVIDTKYYRYYTSASSTGYAGGLKYALTKDSYDRLVASYPTPDSATDAQVAGFADDAYEYDSGRRVTKHTQQGAGSSSAAGGLGTSTLSYTTSTFGNGYNSWRVKTVETLPDGSLNTIYTNYAGQTMLTSFKPAGSSNEWLVFNKYDSSGRLVLTAQPSAVSGYDETKADLLNSVSGNYQYLRDSQGLISTTSYYSSTTATSTTAGGVSGYAYQTGIQSGETGSTVLQSTQDYFSRTDGSTTIYPVANLTRYRNANGTGAQTTSYAYTWYSGTIQPQQVTVTLPTVTTAQNGSNTAETSSVVTDDRGRMIWSKDGGGYLNYIAYDEATGAIVKTLRDVDTTQTTTFANLPSGWATPSGGGLQQTTTYEVDNLGRTTKETDPNGNITYRVYNDSAHEVRTYPGWDSTTNLPTGPTTVSREDRARGYVETLTMSATPNLIGGRPDGTEAIGGVQTLSRQVLNPAGQAVYSDQYFNLTGITYSQSSVTLGTAYTNYYRTETSYDSRGRVERTLTPSGTIYRTVFDGLGRESSQWVGTDDTPTTGTWSPTNTAGTDLVKLSDNTYDSGGIGDSNLTETISYPGGGAANRVTDYSYDWRERLIATKSGVETSESTSVNRPINYVELDNLGEVLSQETYDGDGVGITTDANADGVPDRPSSGLLRSKTTFAYDEQARKYQQSVFSVDPSTGAVSTNALTTKTWFDSRQDVVKTSDPGGLFTKTAFDGLMRPMTNYLTDGGGDSTYADALTVTGDAVLNQADTAYDIGSRPLLVTNRDRFHDETGTGALGTPTTGVKARVSYSATYYDKADRTTDTVDVGTNGGSTYTRPSTVPSRSDTVLVSSTGYNSAGWAETSTDPRGIIGKTYYDNMGRVTKSIDNYIDGVVSDTDDKTVEYTYDPSGNKATLRADLTGGGYQETKWVYGITSPIVSNDVLKETRYPDPSTGAASSTDKESLTYNQLGQTLTKTDRIGTVHTYAYDTLGREVSDTVSTLGTGVDGSVRRVETAYDGQGNPYLITTYDATTSGSVVNQIQRAYNGLGQMTQEWQATSGAVNTGTTPSVQYGYSFAPSGSTNHSRLTSITYPNGRVLTYNYATGLADNISRLSSITDGATTLESYDYLGLGTVVRRAHAQTGVDQTYVKLTGESDSAAGDKYIGLDAFGRVVDQRWTTSGGTAADRFGYAYDRDSNRLYKENLVSSTNSELYSYDSLNQLSSFQRGTLNGTKTGLTGSASRSQSWDFDALGNFDSQTTDGTTQTRTVNKQNEITSISGATTPTYDSNGNLTKDETGRTFTYDAWNRLATVKDSGGTLLATYKWDGQGQRVREIRGSTTTDLYYSNQWQVLEERVGGVAKFSYAWSPVCVDAMIARDRDTDANGTLDERLYAVQDANFNVTALLSTSGTVVERYKYDPFGKFGVLDGSWASRGSSSYGWNYLHQGGRWDADGGVYSFRNRELSPTLGRWLQLDPIGFAGGDENLFRYEGNDPVRKIDPNGTDFWDWMARRFYPSEVQKSSELDEQLKDIKANDPSMAGSMAGNADKIAPEAGVDSTFLGFQKINRLQELKKLRREALDQARKNYIDAPLTTILFLGGIAAVKMKNAVPSTGVPKGTIVVTPNGKSFRIPEGWVGRTADSGKGIVFQRPGAKGNADMIRIMDPTANYPKGYFRYYNKNGQPLDALGKPGNNDNTHFDNDFIGLLPAWPR